MLEFPLREEFDEFVEDCVLVLQNEGFTIIERYTSVDSKKSHYVVVFGNYPGRTANPEPCGELVFDVRISDHNLRGAGVPDEVEELAQNYMVMNNILEEETAKNGINFKVKKVTVGSVANDTWNVAFRRFQDRVKSMKSMIRSKYNVKKNKS